MKTMALLLTSSALLLASTGAFAQSRAASPQQVQARAQYVRNQPAVSNVTVSSVAKAPLTIKASTNRDEGVRVRSFRVGGDRWGFAKTTTSKWEPGGDPSVAKMSSKWAWSAGPFGKASGSRSFDQKEVAHGSRSSALVQSSQSQSSKSTPFSNTSTTTATKTVHTHSAGYLNTRRDSVTDTRTGANHTTVASSSQTRGSIDSSSAKVTLSSTASSPETTVKTETSGGTH